MHLYLDTANLYHIYLHLYPLQWIANSVQKSVSDP